MSNTPKRRPRHKQNPSPSSSNPFIRSITEPPNSLFPSKDELLQFLAVLAIASSVAVVCNFVVPALYPAQKPFCDSNIEFVDTLSDSCETCPTNGQCHDGKLECDRGYRRQRNLCVEDGDINEAASELARWVGDRLCKDYAQLLCGATGIIWARESDIWNDLDGHELMEKLGSDNVIWLHTKTKTMETIVKLMEARKTSFGIKELKCPDLVAEHYKPATCRIQHWISKHALFLIPICALVLGCTILFWKVHRRRVLSRRVEDLYHQVCDILEENALVSKNVNGECEPWVVASQLRDHLLSPRERRNPVFWKKVEELIQEDSRVDRYPKLVKGESRVVWEWQVEGSISNTRLKTRQEASKVKPSEGIKITSSKEQHGELKAENKAWLS